MLWHHHKSTTLIENHWFYLLQLLRPSMNMENVPCLGLHTHPPISASFLITTRSNLRDLFQCSIKFPVNFPSSNLVVTCNLFSGLLQLVLSCHYKLDFGHDSRVVQKLFWAAHRARLNDPIVFPSNEQNIFRWACKLSPSM